MRILIKFNNYNLQFSKQRYLELLQNKLQHLITIIARTNVVPSSSRDSIKNGTLQARAIVWKCKVAMVYEWGLGESARESKISSLGERWKGSTGSNYPAQSVLSLLDRLSSTLSAYMYRNSITKIRFVVYNVHPFYFILMYTWPINRDAPRSIFFFIITSSRLIALIRRALPLFFSFFFLATIASINLFKQIL